MRAERGFTLVETLVALGVLALALPALLLALQQRADSAAHLRDLTLANWVAADRLELLRIESALGIDPRAAAQQGSSTQADREWYWTIEWHESGVRDLLRVDVLVASERGGPPRLRLGGFVPLAEADAASTPPEAPDPAEVPLSRSWERGRGEGLRHDAPTPLAGEADSVYLTFRETAR